MITMRIEPKSQPIASPDRSVETLSSAIGYKKAASVAWAATMVACVGTLVASAVGFLSWAADPASAGPLNTAMLIGAGSALGFGLIGAGLNGRGDALRATVQL